MPDMKLTDVVMQYDIRVFIGEYDPHTQLYFTQLIEQTTHLYFHAQSTNINANGLHKFVQRLRECHNVVSINLSQCTFSSWDGIIDALLSLPKLQILNVRGCSNLDTAAIRRCLHNTLVIDDTTRPYALPPEYGQLRYNTWTKQDIIDMLLVGFTIYAQNQQFINPQHKISRKYAPIPLPFSVLIADSIPYLAIKNVSFTRDITDHNKTTNRNTIRYLLRLQGVHINDIAVMFSKKYNLGSRRRPLDTALRETKELRHTQAATTLVIGQPISKLHHVQEFITGHSLFDILMLDVESGNVPSFDNRICTALSVALAVASYSMQGKVHGDIKPQNLIITQNGTARLIDHETSTDCTPGGNVRIAYPITTLAYLPKHTPRGTINYAMASDWFALALVIRQIMVRKAYQHKDNLWIDADPREEYFDDLNKFYHDGLQLVCQKNRFAAVVTNLLDMLIPSDKPTCTIETLLDAAQACYPQQYQKALSGQYADILDRIKKTCTTYPSILSWLLDALNQHKQNPHALNLFKALNKQMPSTYTQEDLFYITTIQHLLWIFACYKGQASDTVIAKAMHIASCLHALSNLQLNNLHEIFKQIHEQVDIFYRIQDSISPMLVGLAKAYEKEYADRREITEGIIVLQKQANSLLHNDTPLNNILRLVIDELETIYATHDDISLVELAKVIDHFRDDLDTIGESNTCTLRSNNILLSTIVPPQLISPSKPPVPPNETLFAAVIRRNISALSEKLQNGANPYAKYGHNVSAIQYAFSRIDTPTDLDIITQLLQHVQKTEMHRLYEFFQPKPQGLSELQQRAQVILYYKLITLPDYYHPIFKTLVENAIKFGDYNLIRHIITAGFNPLTGLDISLNNFATTGFASCFGFAKCVNEQPYIRFIGCTNNIITLCMHNRDYERALMLLEATDRIALDTNQLGFHLVVAARNKQTRLVERLIQLGASTDVGYPCGYYQGQTYDFFNSKHSFCRRNTPGNRVVPNI